MHHRLPVGTLLVVLSVVFVVGAGTVASSGSGQGGASAQSAATARTVTEVTPVSECQRITNPGYYRLANNITNATQKVCIRIVASDVTFDGAGHRIDGVGNYWTTDEDNPTIAVKAIGKGETIDHLTNVTIKNVVTTQYGYGFFVARGSKSRIVDNIARSNGKYGIYAGYNANNNTIARNRVSNTTNSVADVDGEGIVLAHSANYNEVRNNYIEGTDGLGIAIWVGNHTRVVNNTILDSSRIGIRDAGIGTTIVDNVVNRSGDIGILGMGSATTVVDNLVTRSEKVGINYHDAINVEIRGNEVRDNHRGIVLRASHGVEISRNVVAGQDLHGVVLFGETGEIVLRRNTFEGNSEWDILSEEHGSPVTVDRATFGDGTSASFEGRKIAVSGSPTVPEPLPAGTQQVGGALEVWSAAGDLAWLDLRLSYDQRSVAEGMTTDLWVYRGGWRQVPASEVQRDTGELSTNVTAIGRNIYLVVGASAEGESDETTAAESDETTETRSDGTTDGPTEEPTVETATGGGGSGFGIAGVVLALLVAGLLARIYRGRVP